jgi:hypothetical protein
LLVALHSFGVAIGMLFLTRWCVSFGGWGEATPLFFARQSGAFHVVVAAGYLIEYARHRTVTLLVTTKAIALVFLVSMTIVDRGPWIVPFSALTDGLMGLGVWVAHRAALEARQPARSGIRSAG